MRRWLGSLMLPALLLTAAVVLLLQIVDEARMLSAADATQADRLASRAMPSKDAEAPPPEVALAPFSTYAEVLERPLFSPSRRPAAKDAGPANVTESARTPFTIRLHGIAASGPVAVALVSSGGDGQPQRVHAGDEIAGWRVEAVGRETVSFRRGAETRRIGLDFRRGGP